MEPWCWVQHLHRIPLVYASTRTLTLPRRQCPATHEFRLFPSISFPINIDDRNSPFLRKAVFLLLSDQRGSRTRPSDCPCRDFPLCFAAAPTPAPNLEFSCPLEETPPSEVRALGPSEHAFPRQRIPMPFSPMNPAGPGLIHRFLPLYLRFVSCKRVLFTTMDDEAPPFTQVERFLRFFASGRPGCSTVQQLTLLPTQIF